MVVFLGKGIFAFALLRQLTPNKALAFFTAVLFLIYPADTGLFTFRAIHIHGAISLLLLAVYLLIVYWRNPRWYTLLGIWTALAASLLMYEIAYPIALFAPLLFLYISSKINRRLLWVACLWYVVPILTGIRTLIILKQPVVSFQTNMVTNLPTNPIGLMRSLLRPLPDIFERSFVGGWQEAISGFNYNYVVIAVLITIITLICSYWLDRRLPSATLTTRKTLWRYGLLMAIGIAVIPLGFALYSLSAVHVWQVMRTYLIPSFGAALCIVCLVWLVSQPSRYRMLLRSVLLIPPIALSSVSALNDHELYNILSLEQQRLLGQMMSQAPGIVSGTSIFIVDKVGYFVTENNFAYGLDLIPAINYVYGTQGINSYICQPYEMMSVLNVKCAFQQRHIRVTTINSGAPPVEVDIDYGKAVIFELMPDANLQLVTEHTRGNFADLADVPVSYTVPTSITNAPLPHRAFTLFNCWPVETCTPSIEYPAQQTVHIDFGEPIHGIGWHGIEISPNGAHYRWSVASICELYTHLEAGHNYAVRLRLAGTTNPTVLSSLKMESNNHPIPLELTSDGSTLIVLNGTIPAETIANAENLTILTFMSDLEVVPGTDISLGLAFSEIFIEAID